MKNLSETKFALSYINKYGSLMAQGNGYLGLRASHEEDYPGQVRGMYLAGVYNRPAGSESAELVNLPDIAGMRIELDGQLFSLQMGKIVEYERHLALGSGLLTRRIIWRDPRGRLFELIFERVVGKTRGTLIGSRVSIKSLDQAVGAVVTTGIDGQQTNFGTQQLVEEKLHVAAGDFMVGHYETIESDRKIVIAAKVAPGGVITAKNRQIKSQVTLDLEPGQAATLEKIAVVCSDLDIEATNMEIGRSFQQKDDSSEAVFATLESGALAKLADRDFDWLKQEVAQEWTQFWGTGRVMLESKEATANIDQLALDFASYHLEIMTPKNDPRMSVGAKGLTGEGYKGHVFWDTEIFIMPYFLHHSPETAKNMLLYRYHHLQEAKEKAQKYGYSGALFPWESAFSGREETPEFAAINIRTGKRQRIASALAEHHIVADIAYAVWSYFQATQDQAFMGKYGRALLRETAEFWLSRAVRRDGRYQILDVIGPDEYTEHVDNNAYTNYLAAFNVRQAMRFNQDETDFCHRGADFLAKLYLPAAGSDGIVPQDDTFLTKPQIDLAKYKQAQGKQGILLDYSRAEVIDMQILKQADLVMLFYLLPQLFSADIVAQNLSFYEERTIHDSSLSKAIHAIVACRSGDVATAYRFFQEACLIDLGGDPHSSDDGIHAAAAGAIWLSAVFGFAGVDTTGVRLRFAPRLPAAWQKMSFHFWWQNEKLHIELKQGSIKFSKSSTTELEIEVNGKLLKLTGEAVEERI
ncbi:glycoside hydrolase family 65 protein [Listeria costaricensis]|uniref:glycoside hydrolase family 65 protein n=1 Tax=Listeria costaricensis TaxID=2026604 RepID=UPI000C06D951|nr:glycosyl hydrolase family 65 protein [Listeria costaricensis]